MLNKDAYPFTDGPFIGRNISNWVESDSNQRRRNQWIYNPPPLTTRASTLFNHVKQSDDLKRHRSIITKNVNFDKILYCKKKIKLLKTYIFKLIL